MSTEQQTVFDLCSPEMLDVQRGLILCAHPDDDKFRDGYSWVFNSIPEFEEDAFANVCERAGVSVGAIKKRILQRSPNIHQRYLDVLNKQNPVGRRWQ